MPGRTTTASPSATWGGGFFLVSWPPQECSSGNSRLEGGAQDTASPSKPGRTGSVTECSSFDGTGGRAVRGSSLSWANRPVTSAAGGPGRAVSRALCPACNQQPGLASFLEAFGPGFSTLLPANGADVEQPRRVAHPETAHAEGRPASSSVSTQASPRAAAPGIPSPEPVSSRGARRDARAPAPLRLATRRASALWPAV